MKNSKMFFLSLSRRMVAGSLLIGDKIISGIRMACQKRPVSTSRIEEFTDSMESHFQDLGKKEIDSSEVGEMVINTLREWDEVAYVRFASVYRQFKDIKEFMSELEDILKARQNHRDDN